MQSNSQIIIQQLNYLTPDNNLIFRDLTLSFGANKIAIIGKNGIGKSTLLKLIIGELMPSFGTIKALGEIAYCPQDSSRYLENTVAEFFAVEQKLQALNNIMAGSIGEYDFAIIGDDWLFTQRLQAQLTKFGLGYLDFSRKLATLSGGELTRLWLAKVFFSEADFIVLDEPTNNLDISAKEAFYQAVSVWRRGIIIVSHDRKLLNLMEQIIELTALQVKIYGGNYEYYLEQKRTEKDAQERQLNDAKKIIKITKQSIQKTMEKHEQRQSQGRKARKTGSQAKILLNGMRDRSGRTQSKLSIRGQRLLETAERGLEEAKKNIEINNQIKIELPKTLVPNDKVVVELVHVIFSYDVNSVPIINDFNLIVRGPERIAIVGANGSGKTTLVKLISGVLKPLSGEIYVGVNKVSYLAQQVTCLDSKLSVLDNFKNFNQDINETESRHYLAQFLFKDREVLKLVDHLSGGEKLRAMLASVLMAKQPPQLLILDEPTNHLDLESIAAIESALCCFQGAIMVISHDELFIKNIKATKVIEI